MRYSLLSSLLAATSALCAQDLRLRDYSSHDFYALQLDALTSPADIATQLGLEYEGQLGELADHHLFRAPKHQHNLVENAVQELKRKRRKRGAWEPDALDSILYHQKQEIKKRMVKRAPPRLPIREPSRADLAGAIDPLPVAKTDEQVQIAARKELMQTLDIQDPIFDQQWHLFNTLEVGNDLNVTGLWLEGVTGQGSTVVIVDDGLDMDSDDLRDNYFEAGSYDFNDHVKAPKPRLSDDRHGTRCAGEVAAGKNNACGVGVAWDARIAGVRILSGGITDADEAIAMNYAMNENDIYSCSWGPPDDGESMDAPGILIKRAMLNGVQKGRQGRGSIYVFAAGNGAANEDNCNFDGYTNSIYSVTVGAIEKRNIHPYYSEKCSAQLVVTYSSGPTDAIHTTDVGTATCSTTHGGTSAAGPLAAGIYALALQVRPELTWRDIQWLTVNTAVPIDTPSDWQDTPYGKSFSHQFGYGKLDAYTFVEAAKTFDLVKPQAWFYSPWMHVKTEIPQGDQGLASRFEVTADALKTANLDRLEHITVTMNVEHTRRGDLSVELLSPSGIVSQLSTTRRRDSEPVGYVDWTFMSVAHWGETGIGNWTVIVKDTNVNEHIGTFTDWKLRLYGECLDAKSQELMPMPTEHDDDDHDRIEVDPHTTSIEVPTATGTPEGNPSDHPERPVKPKPSDANAIVTPSKPGADTPPVQTAAPGDSGSEDEVVEEPKPTSTSSPSTSASASASASATPSATGIPDSFLPSPFPTFGVSKRTQVWIYGSVALILAFCSSLAAYFYLARRKRLRNNPRSEYEFELVGDDEDGEAGAGGRRKGGRGRRAGELYDAFAGESEEELFSDEEENEGAYRDHGYDRYGEVEGEKGAGRGVDDEEDEKRALRGGAE
ncbi:neuroendocrine convertase [Saccharata proteae CBS 121410]|uniref:Neuroendocrine convertase n=1 Tax=Saccharata proteae CBS 121410 TaxID=1314787 RepID=A0A9P4LXX2_9PEZI|nr:neuroendocrine convertase [Saccharata proteae CBS 121410]